MLSAWSVLWAAFAIVASAAPSQYGQKLQKTVVAAPAVAAPAELSSGYGSNYGQKLPEMTESELVTPADFPGFDCSDKEDGAVSEGGCDSSYWLCWKGVATSQECPNNLMFNMDNGQCDIADNVYACSGVPSTPAMILSDNAPMADVDFDCSHLEDGDYSFSDSSCQDKYVSCVAGAAWERTCPEGLSFDLENRVCMMIENIVACGGSPPSAPTEAPVLIISFDCPTPTGKFAVVSELCGATYYNCVDNVASIAYCDEPMIWDDSNKQCNLPKDIPECSFDCSGKADSSFSDGCSRNYWWCWHEKATKLACPDNMVFDGERALCDHEANVAECGGVATTPVILNDNATPAPVDFDCSNKDDGQYAFTNGDVCQPRFVSCVGKIAYEMACPDGLMFDPDQMLCERLDAIVACGGTAEPMTTTYSYTYRTTLAAEPTTLKMASYGSYQAPALKKVKHVNHIEKASYQAPAFEPTTRRQILTTLAPEQSYGSYEAPAFEPTTRRQILTTMAPEQSYGSYEAPAFEPTTRRQILTTMAPEQSYGSYQAPVAKLVQKPVVRKAMKATTIAADELTTLSSNDYYQTEATFFAAEPTTRLRLRPRHETTLEVLDSTTPLDYGFALGSAPVVRSVFSSGYDNLEMPAAEPTIRRHIKTALTADQSYGSYQAPAFEPTTLAPEQSYGSYEAPAAEPATLRHVKKISALAAEPMTRAAYGYQTPVLAEEPTTRSYQLTTLAAEPVTILSAYGSKKIVAAAPIKKIAAAAPY